VDRARRETPDAAVSALSRELADELALRYVGPLAPYAFVDLSLDLEEPAWA